MSDMITEQIASLEAVLFAIGDPISAAKLSEATDIQEESIPLLMQKLEQRYQESGSAITVLKLEHEYQLSARPQFATTIRNAMEQKKSTPLSNAAMETLTVIAYNQPVTKGFVERVRGVDSSNVVNNLVEKGLIEEAGRIDVPGRPMSYRTTPHFLLCFHLESIEDLPPLPQLSVEVTEEEENPTEEFISTDFSEEASYDS